MREFLVFLSFVGFGVSATGFAVAGEEGGAGCGVTGGSSRDIFVAFFYMGRVGEKKFWAGVYVVF